MYGGIILALPVILWQIWRFIVPALNAKEKKYAIPFVLSSVVLFIAGGTLAYLTVAQALDFLISWAGEDVGQVFSVSSYISPDRADDLRLRVGFLLPVLIVFLQLVGRGPTANAAEGMAIRPGRDHRHRRGDHPIG